MTKFRDPDFSILYGSLPDLLHSPLRNVKHKKNILKPTKNQTTQNQTPSQEKSK